MRQTIKKASHFKNITIKRNRLRIISFRRVFATLSKTHCDWRKIEPVTMKANFIHFWCVESEFMIKNWFHNWTSELGCIWHIFGKLGYFCLFLENPDIQVTVNITVNKAQSICSSWLLLVLKCLERAKFSKNVPNAP